MRVLGLLALASPLVAAGCGTSSSENPSDAAVVDGGADGYRYLPPKLPPCDGGGTEVGSLSAPNDDKVQCFDSAKGMATSCVTFLKGNVVCCGSVPVECSDGTWKCTPATDCKGTRSFQCDENDDCPSFLVCCGTTNSRGLITGSVCQKDCTGPQICTKTGECPSGSTCRPSVDTDTPFTLGVCEPNTP